MVHCTFGMLKLVNQREQLQSIGKSIEIMRILYKLTFLFCSSVICGVSWNPNGDFLYTAEKNKTVCMWDTSTELKKQ